MSTRRIKLEHSGESWPEPGQPIQPGCITSVMTLRGGCFSRWFTAAAAVFLSLSCCTRQLHADTSSEEIRWYFLPTGTDSVPQLRNTSAADIAEGRVPAPLAGRLSQKQDAETSRDSIYRWHRASFPHTDFDRLQSDRNVYGWYACVFTVPEPLKDRDLLLDLGVIDDADMTYVNGVLVGQMGSLRSQGSAWNQDRRYRIPADTLQPGRNLILVHVYDKWGLGGIVGPPVLKAPLTEAEAQWDIAFPDENDGQLDIGAFNRITSLPEDFSGSAQAQSLQWRKSPIPYPDWRRWSDDRHCAVFRTTFEKSPVLSLDRNYVLDIGPVFDVCSVFLNGKRMGLTGRFPDEGGPAFTESAACGQYLLQPEALQAEENELVIVIYRERGIGGLPGVPGILLQHPVGLPSAQLSGEASASAAAVLIQSLRFDHASDVLERASEPESPGQAIQLLSLEAYLSWLRFRDGSRNSENLDKMLSQIKLCLERHPVESPLQSAMQAFCRVLRLAETDPKMLALVRRHFPQFAQDCLYLGQDWKTQGDWQLNYGGRYYVLAAMGQVRDWEAGTRRPRLPYALKIPGDKDKARLWLPRGQRELDNPSALLMHGDYKEALAAKPLITMAEAGEHILPKEKVRRASWWDDHGETHPFDDQGPDLLVETELPEGWQQLSYYLLDYDWRHTLHPRQQSAVIFDDAGNLLNAAWSAKIDAGVYERFAISGNRKIRARFNKHRGACVAVSGLFVDLAPVLPELPRQLAGAIPEQCIPWYEGMRNATGPARIAMAREYRSMSSNLLAEDCGVLGVFLYLAGAECCFETHQATASVADRLRQITDAASLNGLLSAVNRIDEVHPRWHYLVAARQFEILQDQPPEVARTQLEALFMNCREYILYPLRGVTANYWRDRGLSVDDPAYEVMFRSLPEKVRVAQKEE